MASPTAVAPSDFEGVYKMLTWLSLCTEGKLENTLNSVEFCFQAQLISTPFAEKQFIFKKKKKKKKRERECSKHLGVPPHMLTTEGSELSKEVLLYWRNVSFIVLTFYFM